MIIDSGWTGNKTIRTVENQDWKKKIIKEMSEFKYPVTENYYPQTLKTLEETPVWLIQGIKRPERFPSHGGKVHTQMRFTGPPAG